MIDHLADAHEKLRWARHHFELLRPQIEAFEQHDMHRFTIHINRESGEYMFRVHDLEPPDPDWGLQVGDCIHNARTALDYVAVRLWAFITGTRPGDVKDLDFPICSVFLPDPVPDDAKVVDKAYAHARDTFKGFAAKCSKHPAFSGYLARIEELQPYNNGNVSIWGTTPGGLPRQSAIPNALDRLSRLDNIDKHRVPHITWVTINVFSGPDIGDVAPSHFKSLGGGTTFAPLVDGAEVGTWRFQTPLPSEWEPSQVDMKRCFPLQVAFDQPSPFQGVLEVLALCLWGVEAVLQIFEPVFLPGNPQPPLPVTAIREPGQ